MKKILNEIGNFFKKTGLFIWKYIKVAWSYVCENAWIQPIAIVALIFAFVFGLQGVVDAIEGIGDDETAETGDADKFTKLTMKEVREKLDNGDDFVLFIGAHDCVYCNEFKTVVNKYVGSTENMIFYIDIHDDSDTSIDAKYLVEWAEMLGNIETRDFDGKNLSTPTVVVVRDGEFADAKSGAQGLSGGMEYLNFVKFVEGEYIDKIESTTNE